MAFTYRVEISSEGKPEIWIDNSEGYPAIHQPHHPQAVNFAPWESREAAEVWATGFVAQLNNPPAAQKEEF